MCPEAASLRRDVRNLMDIFKSSLWFSRWGRGPGGGRGTSEDHKGGRGGGLALGEGMQRREPILGVCEKQSR